MRNYTIVLELSELEWQLLQFFQDPTAFYAALNREPPLLTIGSLIDVIKDALCDFSGNTQLVKNAHSILVSEGLIHGSGMQGPMRRSSVLAKRTTAKGDAVLASR